MVATTNIIIIIATRGDIDGENLANNFPHQGKILCSVSRPRLDIRHNPTVWRPTVEVNLGLFVVQKNIFFTEGAER